MKRVKFRELFLLFAVVSFVVSDRDIYSTILLILSSVYLLMDVVPKLWKEWKRSWVDDKRIQTEKRISGTI